MPPRWSSMRQGIARLRLLKTSRAIGDKWLVTDGLKAGDRLIVEGLQKVAAGRAGACRCRHRSRSPARRLMGLSQFFIERPVFAWVIAIVIMLAGVLAIMHAADRAISRRSRRRR